MSTYFEKFFQLTRFVTYCNWYNCRIWTEKSLRVKSSANYCFLHNPCPHYPFIFGDRRINFKKTLHGGNAETYPEGFSYRSTSTGSRILIPNQWKTINLILKKSTMSTQCLNNPYPSHPYMFITENSSSKFTIIFFWAPALKSPA